MSFWSCVAGLVLLGATSTRADTVTISPKKIESLPAFLDARVPQVMQEHHIVGATLAVVHDGRVVALRGYGHARLDTGQQSGPSQTLFRVGSVTKLLTAVAAMQLVDAGRLDLHRDIRAYLPDVPLPSGLTAHQLLTHTTGLLERFAGSATYDIDRIQPLPEHLRHFLPTHAFAGGHAYSYSSYNTALTGLLVETIAGQPYDRYLAEHVLWPLKMTRSTAHQPPDPSLAGDLARGYEWRRGTNHPLPYRYYHPGPAGSLATTADDMSRFMIAMLESGVVEGSRILTPTSTAALLATQYAPDPRIPGVGYEFEHWPARGQDLVVKSGTLGDQMALMVLAPASHFGFFAASNSSTASAGEWMFDPLITHLFGPEAAVPPLMPAGASGSAARVAGTYRDYRHTWSEMSQIRSLMPMMQSRVTIAADGAIVFRGRRWVEIEPLVFRDASGPDHIVFRTDDRGEVSEIHARLATYERIGWWQTTPVHLAIAMSCVLVFVVYSAGALWRAVHGRVGSDEGRYARRCGLLVAALNLLFVAGAGLFLQDAGTAIPPPLAVAVWLLLPVASAVLTATLLALSVRVWRQQWWIVAASVVFLSFLNYWRLLGVRY